MIEKINIKGGEFIVKETESSHVFTPEDFSEEHKMMINSVIEVQQKT